MMPGMIMLWYGSVETIPSGWHLCDGSMGTPDLRTRFVRSVYSDTESPKPGETGGSNWHQHTFTGDGHKHDLTSGYDLINSSPTGNFSHGTSVSAASGTVDEASNIPYYYALCYIMKL